MGQSGQEKTEQPTAKKRRDARKEGNIFQSRDVSTVVILAGIVFRDPHMASFYIWTDEKLYDMGHRWGSTILRRYAFSQPCFCYTVCDF